MVINADNARQVEDLFREHLDRHFQGIDLKFDPVVVEPIKDQYGEDTFHVTVVYEGDQELLDARKINTMGVEIEDHLSAMGIWPTVLDSYIIKEEYLILDELLGPEDWELEEQEMVD